MFVKNDLFEQVIKSCKSNSTEFLVLKEKLGICLYEENYYEKEIIQKRDEEPIKVIDRVSNDESNKESDNTSDNKSNKKIRQ